MGLLHEISGEIETILVLQGFAHVVAFRCDEGIRHAAADQDDIGFFHQIRDDLDLVADLRAADDGSERTLRLFDNAVKEIDFFLQQQSGYHRHQLADTGNGCMASVRYTECVIDRQVAAFDQSFCKGRIILFFFFMKTKVFKEQDFARCESRFLLLCFFADAVRGEFHIHVQQFGKALSDRRKRQVRLHFTLRTAHMARNDEGSAMVKKPAQRRQGRHDAAVIGDMTFLVMRHIVVHADIDGLAFRFQIINGLLVHSYSPFDATNLTRSMILME